MATVPVSRVTDLARRWRVDIDTATYPASGYVQLLGIKDVKPVREVRTADDEVYEDAGAMREAVTGTSWHVDLSIGYSKDLAGTTRDPVHAFLRNRFDAFLAGASAAANEFGVMFYDRTGMTSEAYEGRCYVKSWGPPGGKSTDDIALVLQGQGPLALITNPAASALPAVTGLTPATGTTAGGTLVQIFGRKFTGVTGVAGVKFGANNATAYTLIHDGLIVAVAPAGTAGNKQVIVTTPAGVSVDTAADDYIYV